MVAALGGIVVGGLVVWQVKDDNADEMDRLEAGLAAFCGQEVADP